MYYYIILKKEFLVEERYLIKVADKTYDDLAKKPLGEAGNALANLVKFIALPFSFLGMTADELNEKYKKFIKKALNGTKEVDRVEPNPRVVSSLFEYVKYIFYEYDKDGAEELYNMFADLLAASISRDMTDKVHPAHIEILKQITNDEAKIINHIKHNERWPIIDLLVKPATEISKMIGVSGKSNIKSNEKMEDYNKVLELGATIRRNVTILGYQAGCKFPDKTNIYIDNLERLGLIRIGAKVLATGEYDNIRNSDYFKSVLNEEGLSISTIAISKKYFRVTNFGKTFIDVCTK